MKQSVSAQADYSKTCIVSPGLDVRRVRSLIGTAGATAIVVVHFPKAANPGARGNGDHLMAQLSAVREELRAALEADSRTVVEVECGQMTPDAVAACLLAVEKALRGRGAHEITLGIGSGHTMFKLGAFIAACLAPPLSLKYGYTDDYLELHAHRLAVAQRKVGSGAAKFTPEVVQEVDALVKFSVGGGAGGSISYTDVPVFDFRPPNGAERVVLDVLVENNGMIPSYRDLARAVVQRESHWLLKAREERSASPGKATKKPAIERVARELQDYTIKTMANRALVHVTRGPKFVGISMTRGGKVLHSILRKAEEIRVVLP